MCSMIRKANMCLLSIVCGLLITGLVQAANHTTSDQAYQHKGAKSHSQKTNKRIQKLAKQLNLTDEQQQMIANNMKASIEKMKATKQQLQSIRHQIKQLQQQGYFDDNIIKKLARQQGDAVTKLTMLRLQSRQFVFSVLTPEQREKYKAIQKKRAQKRSKSAKDGDRSRGYQRKAPSSIKQHRQDKRHDLNIQQSTDSVN